MNILVLSLALSSQVNASDNTDLIAPVLTSTPSIEYPEAAPQIDVSLSVQVEITISQTGTVSAAKVIQSGGKLFDQATLDGVKQLKFKPAYEGGEPIEVVVPYTHRFEPRPPPVKRATLEGELFAQGIRETIPFATLLVETSSTTIMVTADKDGQFTQSFPPGPLKVVVSKPGFRPFHVVENLEADEALRVRYLLEPEGLNPYDVTVYANRQRLEMSKTTLRNAELTTVPGTFGDPFRAVSTLPGVSPIISLLPFPVVRGSSPGSTGFLIDGVRVSHLFHLLAGPSVIHPGFIDEIDFHPGTFSVDYGGYTGGIINARSAESGDEDRTRYETNLNLLESGLYIGHLKLAPQLKMSAAGRFGYPGALLSLAQDEVSLSYWDYQAKVTYGSKNHHLSVFVFGARDNLENNESDEDAPFIDEPFPPDRPPPDDRPPDDRPPDDDSEPDDDELEPNDREGDIVLSFHRADVKHIWRGARFESQNQVSFVLDETLLDSVSVRSYSVIPRLRFSLFPQSPLNIRLGIDGQYRRSEVDNLNILRVDDDGVDDDGVNDDGDGLFQDVGDPTTGTLLSGGALVEALWRPTPRWLVRAGVRSDVIEDETATLTNIDPRIFVRYGLGGEPDAPLFSLKGGVGIYHQPPRLPIPLPGIAEIALERNLQRSIQSSLGFETKIQELFVDIKGYYNHLDPLVLDLDLNEEPLFDQNPLPTTPPGEEPRPISDDSDFGLADSSGRSYGLEVLLRRESSTGVFGWLSYALSRSERDLPEGGRQLFDFDRTHVLNMVAGIRLQRSWQLGLRAAYFSGRPIDEDTLDSVERTGGSFRFDLRVDKTAVYRNYLFNFYFDVRNAFLSPEEVSQGDELIYVLPTLGLRIIF